MNEHSFCREWLREAMVEVRQRFTDDEIKKAWAWGDGRSFEFHGPNGEYLYNLNQADCLWSAKASGWNTLMHPASED